MQNLQDLRAVHAFQVKTALSALSESITAAAAAPTSNNNTSNTTSTSSSSSSSSFPFVTVNAFELIGQYARELSGLELVLFAPLVQPDQLEAWHDYAWTNQDWMALSRDVVEANLADAQEPPSYRMGNISRTIYQFNHARGDVLLPKTASIPPTVAPFLPVWQVRTLGLLLFLLLCERLSLEITVIVRIDAQH